MNSALRRALADGRPLSTTRSPVVQLRASAPDSAPAAPEEHEIGPRSEGASAMVKNELRLSGQPFAGPMREKIEARVGRDLGDRRVHVGPTAERSAQAIDAHAYTSGKHMVFTRSAANDEKVVLEETVHTLQQETRDVAGTDTGHGLRISSPDDADERAAAATVHRLMSGPSRA